MNRLYKVTVDRNYNYYVLAKSFAEAESKAMKHIKAEFVSSAYITQIELVTKELIK